MPIDARAGQNDYAQTEIDHEAELPLDAQQLYALAMDTSILLGWQVLSNDQSELRFRVPLSIFFWGENVFVTVDDGHIQAISESRVPLAMTDWGKNSSNLERFFNRIELVAARQTPVKVADDDQKR